MGWSSRDRLHRLKQGSSYNGQQGSVKQASSPSPGIVSQSAQHARLRTAVVPRILIAAEHAPGHGARARGVLVAARRCPGNARARGPSAGQLKPQANRTEKRRESLCGKSYAADVARLRRRWRRRRFPVPEATHRYPGPTAFESLRVRVSAQCCALRSIRRPRGRGGSVGRTELGPGLELRTGLALPP
jgi:hypothetical protein